MFLPKRSLFKGSAKPHIPQTKVHYEYSISPNTYSFKVPSSKKTLNPIQMIYKNAVNFPFEKSINEVYQSYPTLSSAQQLNRKERPRGVIMSTSDFIEDSLYNKHYGYFSKEVEIYHPEKPFNYSQVNNVDEFVKIWSKSYEKSKSLWHTPTELFSPHYGESLARYILITYKLGIYPYEDLVIYEMGGGNGTLMCDILSYIKKHEPEIYENTQYNIIEISSQLAKKQENSYRKKLKGQGLSADKLSIFNKSIFDWETVVEEPCFFIALEVFDNFAHDVIKYDMNTGEPFEGKVLIDKQGDFYQFFTQELSQYSTAYLNLRENGNFSILDYSNSLRGKLDKFKFNKTLHPLLESSIRLKIKNQILPFNDYLSNPEYIPTRLVKFFNILKHKFPNHSLISSDFHYLPNTINGYNGPVVQTVINGETIDVRTYMVQQGYFDIMFATNFELASDLYRQITGKVSKTSTHKKFLEEWADVEATTTRNGENPMLDFYRNASFLTS
ncbi:hypothetical protein KGF56_002472 [Candida oxycetoniae]|uniref:Protein arginine methyltransferase NDUFAF7 n=1 Tax=Candida oxycetoniae TaxID=497107 RepID=A0AAI9SX46_9ASCO|nr:uncharacterized protein KGF56_002472 [Candida oxycetoniae]KAI3404704.2 hypothetical protein KGF56_002472 [Candida oxycetoniae]